MRAIRVKDELDKVQEVVKDTTALIKVLSVGIGSDEMNTSDRQRAVRAVCHVTEYIEENIVDLVEKIENES